MLFNSFAFLIFFVLCFVAYFLLPHKYRWVLLLVASLYFYMSWNFVYLFLLLGSIWLHYWLGLRISRTASPKAKKGYLVAGLLLSFGTLFLFKYYNFTAQLLHLPTVSLLLPVGISFYTFQTVGYTIDVYRGSMPAERHFGKFALYVSFFPQLVAGPIERAKNLLPQFQKEHRLNWFACRVSLYRVLWGYVKKMVIADRLAIFVNQVYASPGEQSGWMLLLATLGFAVQIYCDFSGYCDIAVGIARMLGFRLMKNFDNPYSATSIQDFWNRWHISLSTWLKDYLYIPLGGNRVGKLRYVCNVWITFIASGIWHGAGFNFLIWGILHGALVTGEKLYRKSGFALLPARWKQTKTYRVFCIVWTFAVVNVAWVFFRAATLSDALTILGSFGQLRLWDLYVLLRDGGLYLAGLNRVEIWTLVGLIFLLFRVENRHPRAAFRLIREPMVVQCVVYVLLLLLVLLCGVYGIGTVQQFIYFQF